MRPWLQPSHTKRAKPKAALSTLHCNHLSVAIVSLPATHPSSGHFTRLTPSLLWLQATQIERDDLKPALIGLSMVKGKMLLKKQPSGKEINDSDSFVFNDKFKSPHLRIKFQAAGAQKEACLCFFCQIVRVIIDQCMLFSCPHADACGQMPGAVHV